ncbi:carbohydrate kinase family protein [Saccharothrix coeruleofusca]|uniref:carbohydrate kinase family protein n=1 Tax=Saccharothrix coeruleofusca TaxID=33919 RepID=UPI001E57C9D2|nr:PfkB family carbohydrate kinase [Saccharothrix coeruleofusca]
MAAVLCVGLTTVDVVQQVIEFPVPGQKMQSLDAHLAPGGPAATAATAVAALGHRAALLTAVGGDPFGVLAGRGLAERGVEVHDVAPPDHGPALSMVVVRERDGERTVVSRNAAAFTPPPVDVAPLVAAAEVVLLDGHLGPTAVAAARAARERGVPVVLDAGSWKPVLDELLPLVDVAACSASFELSEEEVHARGVPLVVRTHGADPVTWSAPTGTGSREVAPVPVRDTNGAGDVWHGALAVAVARGDLVRNGVADAVDWANRVAAVRVRNTARTWVEELARWADG